MNDTRAATPDQAPAPVRDPILVDEAEAARLCGVSKPTFRDWVGAGLVTRVALPKGMRRNLYRLAELKEFADKLAGERS